MSLWIVFSGIFAPAIFWIGYFYYKDRFQPEPFRQIGITFILGILTAYLCVKLMGFLPLFGLPADPSALMESHSWQYLAYSVGITGLIEELFKFLPFLFFVLHYQSFDEKTDGIIYASTIALGFASFENISYLPYLDGFELFGRAFASPLTHTIFSSIWGYTAGTARLSHKRLFWPCVQGLLLAAMCHGLFNFFTTSSSLRIVSSMLILLVWIWRIRILEKSAE